MNALDSQLFAMTGDSFGTLRTQLWNTIDEEISLADCDIYRYVCNPHRSVHQGFLTRKKPRLKWLLMLTMLLHGMKANEKEESVLTHP